MWAKPWGRRPGSRLRALGKAPFFAPRQRVRNGTAAARECEACSVQRRVALVGEGPADGAAIAPHHVGFWGVAGFEVACNGTSATAPLFAGFFGRTVGCIEGLSGLTQVMDVIQWVGCWGEGLWARFPERAVPITDDRHHGHTQDRLAPAQERRQSRGGRGEHAVGE